MGDVKVTLTEFRRKCGSIIRMARITGEPVTITDRGEDVARLTPVIPAQRQPGDDE